ncbi:IS66 family insertion sequence element accessory protein TnpA [Pendulispora rubella]|uniref:IS66 family insertion sequence element accessory protein TnpA n=1 Tax=Pendulispora rubella TaxID=2741070 RepID=UPI0030DFC663
MTETEKKWHDRVAAWRASGKSCEEFAQGQGYAAITLQQWRFRLRKKERDAKTETVALARVVRSDASAAPAMAVDLGGVRIEIRPGFDRTLLRELVAALMEAR